MTNLLFPSDKFAHLLLVDAYFRCSILLIFGFFSQQLYAIPWFLTMFCRKYEASLLFYNMRTQRTNANSYRSHKARENVCTSPVRVVCVKTADNCNNNTIN